MRRPPVATLAMIGGSGLYSIPGLEDVEDVAVETPFGAPSDAIRIGGLGGERVAFLARHGRDHGLLPSEIDYRANVYALKSLGVERVVSVSAVGSMRERIHPREVVTPDQFIDRTQGRTATFFGGGVVAHVGLADPVCGELRGELTAAVAEADGTVHDGGTYVCIEGPGFSTRAESELYRSWGAAVIGMTNATEARLCREAELCYATLAMVTDYDCWHEDEDDVNVDALLENLRANAALAERVVTRVVERLAGGERGCACGTVLDTALLTPPDAVPDEARRRLEAVLARRLGTGAAS